MGTHRPSRRLPYFDRSDAWVFASLQGSVSDDRSIDFALVIGVGDMLNHAILTADEIRNALVKFAKRGLVEIDGHVAKVTALVSPLHDQVAKKRGGLFSVVDNTLAVLNSPRTKLPTLDIEPDVSFVTEVFIHGER